MMNEQGGPLVVPTTALAVEIAWASGDCVNAEIFLASGFSTAAELEGAVRELFARAEFLPIKDADTGAWLLANRAHLAWIRVGPDAVAEPDTRLFDRAARAIISMANGRILEAELLYNMPAERSRPVDVLNAAERLLTVFADGSMWFINKALVERVTH